MSKPYLTISEITNFFFKNSEKIFSIVQCPCLIAKYIFLSLSHGCPCFLHLSTYFYNA